MNTTSGKLTAVQVKTLGLGRHFDGYGMYLEVQKMKSRISRIWYLKYRFGGKERRMSLGDAYELSLAEARRLREVARAQLRAGNDPVAIRRAQHNAQHQDNAAKFPNFAPAWLEYKRPGWSDATFDKAQFITAKYLIPLLKGCSITNLSSKDAATALKSIHAKSPFLAVKARQYLESMAFYAMQIGMREDGKLLALRGALPAHEKGNVPAVTNLRDITALLNAIEAYPTPVMRCALKLIMLTVVRPENVAEARWAEIDLDAAEWTIPPENMKSGHAHIVPLPRQALAVLNEMRGYTGEQEYVFPPLARQKTPHMHRDAMSAAIRRMGFAGKHTPHGFRSTFRTVARERLRVDSDILEAQLAHAKKGEVQRAYDRTQFIEERHTVMQDWADFLDRTRTGEGGNVVQIRRRSQAAA